MESKEKAREATREPSGQPQGTPALFLGLLAFLEGGALRCAAKASAHRVHF